MPIRENPPRHTLPMHHALLLLPDFLLILVGSLLSSGMTGHWNDGASR